jgi:tripartite-type tricarboxylate transporter receptor subunit TctC
MIAIASSEDIMKTKILLLCLLPLFAQAQTFPSKPIRLVSQFGAGASGDVSTRMVTSSVAELLGQPIIIDNRPGAGGAIASEIVANAQPDGYTLLVNSAGPVVRCAAGLKCNADPLKDLTPITPIGDIATGIFVSPTLPVSSLRELIDYAKTYPNKLSYGTSGVASQSHLAAESIQSMTGARMVHVPYKVGNQALLDVVAGQLPVSLSIADLAMPNVRAGKIRALAMVGGRSILAPGVPAVAEVLPGFVPPPSWQGFSGPAKLPPQVLKRLSDAFIRAIKSPEVTGKLNTAGFDVWGYTPEEYSAMIRRGMELIVRITKEANIKIED